MVIELEAMRKLKMGLNYLGLGMVKFQLGQVFGLKGIFLGLRFTWTKAWVFAFMQGSGSGLK